MVTISGRARVRLVVAASILGLSCALDPFGTADVVACSGVCPSLHRSAGASQEPGARPLTPLVVTQLEEDRESAQLDRERTSVATFDEPLTVQALLSFLLAGRGLELAFEPGVAGTFNGELKDVTLREALDRILHPQGLDYDVSGRTVSVFARRLQSRVFDLDTIQPPPAELGVPPVDAPDATADLIAELSAGLETLLSGEGRLRLDRQAAFLQVTDFPAELEAATRYVEAVRRGRHRQVRIQARIYWLEVTRRFASGPDWARVMDRAGEAATLTQPPTSTPIGGVALGVTIADRDALLDEVRDQGRLVELAVAGAVAASDERLMVVADGPRRVVLTRPPAGTAGEAEDPGAALEIVPLIGPEGTIGLKMGRPGLGLPARERSVSLGTLVHLGLQGTAVLSGPAALESADRQAASSLSRLGPLFEQGEAVGDRSYVVVLLTPVVLSPEEVAAGVEPDAEPVPDLGDVRR